MLFCDINPFIRYAKIIKYKSDNNPVYARDYRVFYIIDGNAKVICKMGEFNLDKNCVFFCPSGKMYNIISEGLEAVSVNFDLTTENCRHTESYSPIKYEEGENTEKYVSEKITNPEFLNDFYCLKNGYEFYGSLISIIGDFEKKELLYRELTSAVLKKILVRLYKASIQTPGGSTDTVSKIIEIINNNYEKKISLKDIAANFGYHEYHLNRIFAKITGTSIYNYLQSIRIEQAKKLLINTNLTNFEIAEKVGINSAAHFSAYFKKATGITPKKYRENYKNMI
ncbi:MAG: AraC family transcriptional regulator [Clostridia bacterium]|nr:AraC family transcriptional regulator [Clostridia bacterium]